MAKITHAEMLRRMLPVWRKLWDGVPFSVTAVAHEAGLAAANVQDIVEGENRNYKRQTELRIIAALERLHDRCPECGRKGHSKAVTDESTRRATERGRFTEE